MLAALAVAAPGPAASPTSTHQAGRLIPLLDRLDRIADQAPDLLVEFTAGKQSMLASRIEDMAELLVTLDDHPRVKVCFDTCHAMCAGYDLHDPDTATTDELAKLLPDRLALVHTTSG